MSKLYFFWDCDELLINTVDAFKKFVFEKYGVVLPEDLHDFEKIEDQLGISRSTVTAWWSAFNISDYLSKKGFTPQKELLDFILNLYINGYESHIITSRPEDECKISTEKWKNQYFGKSISSIQFCNTYSENMTLIKRKKSEAIAEFITTDDFFIFADDTHTHAIEVAEAFPENSIVYLLEKTWNKNRKIPVLNNLGKVRNESEMIFNIKMFMQHLHY